MRPQSDENFGKFSERTGSTGRRPVASGGPPEAHGVWTRRARQRPDPAVPPPPRRSLRETFPAGRRKQQAGGLRSPGSLAALAMRILALQLKRIGDLVLITAALRSLRTAWPKAHIGLGVSEGCASLLGAIDLIDSAIVFGPGRGWAPWQQALTGGWDVCLDFTGTDRSALRRSSRGLPIGGRSRGCGGRSCVRWPITSLWNRRCGTAIRWITTSISRLRWSRDASAGRICSPAYRTTASQIHLPLRPNCGSRQRRGRRPTRFSTGTVSADRLPCCIRARRVRRNSG